MIVSSRPGRAEPERQGAKILVFKSPNAASRPQPAVQIESGSGWYHEAAIREAATLHGSKR